MAKRVIRTNAKSVLNSLLRLDKDIQDKVKDAVEQTVHNIEREATMAAPAAGDSVDVSAWGGTSGEKRGEQRINTGINQFIYSKITNNGWSGEVGVEAGATELAAYIEFGTGVSAAGYVPTLPKEFQDLARQFYVNGRGTLIAKPFLIPAFMRHSTRFERAVEAYINSLKLR